MGVRIHEHVAEYVYTYHPTLRAVAGVCVHVAHARRLSPAADILSFTLIDWGAGVVPREPVPCRCTFVSILALAFAGLANLAFAVAGVRRVDAGNTRFEVRVAFCAITVELSTVSCIGARRSAPTRYRLAFIDLLAEFVVTAAGPTLSTFAGEAACRGFAAGGTTTHNVQNRALVALCTRGVLTSTLPPRGTVAKEVVHSVRARGRAAADLIGALIDLNTDLVHTAALPALGANTRELPEAVHAPRIATTIHPFTLVFFNAFFVVAAA